MQHYPPFSVAPVVRLRDRYGRSCCHAGYVVGETLHDPKRTNRTAAAVRSAAVATSSRVPYKKKMSKHKVTLKWERGGAEFSYQKYPRDHIWSFDGGHTMAATAAPAYLGQSDPCRSRGGVRRFTLELSHAYVPSDCM